MYYLITNCSAVNMYKRGNLFEFLASFAEAESSFLFSINYFNLDRLVESFIEYIVIYYPIDKVNTILSILIEQKEWSSEFLQLQQKILKNRNKTTRKSIKSWTQNSEIFRKLLEKVFEIMTEPEFAESDNIQHLTKTIGYILD